MNPASSGLAPAWRREPYRLLFPLGALFVFLGVGPWLLVASGAASSVPPVRFHATVLFECFLFTFATGFLFTYVPRRTATPVPSALRAGVALVAPLLIALFAALEWWALSQAVWLALLGNLISFLISRIRRADPSHQAPAPFAWLLAGLLCGVIGPLLLMASTSGALGIEAGFAYGLGMTLSTQGLFLPLVLGIGQAVLPAFLYGTPPVKGRLWSRGGLVHALLALLLLASFVLEWRGAIRVGWALRGLICAGVLMASGRLYRLPTIPGAHRWLLWLGLWSLPAGCAFVVLWPLHRIAGEHVIFLGLALLVLAFSTHVIVSHSGGAEELSQSPSPVKVYALLLLVALVARVALSFDVGRYMVWLGTAAAALLAAAAVWLGWLSRRLWTGGE